MIKEFFDALREDRGRAAKPVSSDIQDANRLMHHPYVWKDEIAEVLRVWFERKQSCLFGRYASKRGAVHICVLTERDLLEGDKAVKAKIAGEKRLWKQRAVSDRQAPPHSFVLLVNSPRVALAAPDENLYRFATYVRELAGWRPTKRTTQANPVFSELLYLKSPHDEYYYGYQFNIDFFATAGDGRWWHDHRVPGGIAFTANATGHMKQFQEWYEYSEQPDRSDWILRMAMQTISMAHPTAVKSETAETGPAPSARPPRLDPKGEGRATWLRDLEDGKPHKDIACPFKGPVLQILQGKDWTTYEGLLHSDHNVRKEFFEDRPTPSTAARPYLMDFTYLYARTQSDYLKFTGGVRVAEEDVVAEIGSKDTWKTRDAAGPEAQPRTPEAAAEVHRMMNACLQWPDPNDPLL